MHISLVITAKHLEKDIEQPCLHRYDRHKAARTRHGIVLQHVLDFQRPLMKIIVIVDESAPEQYQ